MRNVALFLALCMALVVGCDSNELRESEEAQFFKQLGIDSVLIDNYLSARTIVAMRDTLEPASGIRYVIHETGNGKSPKFNTRGVPGDCFETDYVGKLLDGDVPFDTANGFKTSLSAGIIVGWKRGFQYLQEGDSATIYIPSGYAYGSIGSGATIPKNAVLYFHVRLHRVVTPEFNPANGQYECYYDDL